MELREALRLAQQWGVEDGEGWREALLRLKTYIDLLEYREKYYMRRIEDLEASLSERVDDAVRKQTETIQERIQATKS